MKTLYRNIITTFAIIALVNIFTGCKEADPEFAHPNNLISEMRIKSNTGADGIPGEIFEYNAAGELVPSDQVTIEAVKGGYGRIVFELDPASNIDPERCYLSASLTLSEIITPGLSGLKNITNRNDEGVAQGMEITVTSGIGTTRRYTVIGYYTGEYILNNQ